LAEGNTEIDFIATPSVGDIELFVTRRPLVNGNGTDDVTQPPGPDAFDFSSRGQVGANRAVAITRSDSQETQYLVNVRLADGVDRAVYALAARHNDSEVALALNKPFRDTVATDQLVRYRFAVAHAADALLKISITAETGDPDLILGIGYLPTLNDFTWSSSWKGSDAIVVEPQEINATCIQGCVFHLGVYGSLASTYSIVITNGENAYTPIVAGGSLIGTVGERSYEYVDIERTNMLLSSRSCKSFF
jgi:hypothetical protein